MSDLSTTIRNALWNHLIHGTQHTAPAATYVGLSINGSSELSGNAYARANARAGMGSPTDGVGANTSAIEFAAASGGNWGTVSHAALFSASSAGTQLTGWKALAVSRTVNDGDILRIPVGDLDFSIQ